MYFTFNFYTQLTEYKGIFMKQGIMRISVAQKFNYYTFCFNSEVPPSDFPSPLSYRIIC